MALIHKVFFLPIRLLRQGHFVESQLPVIPSQILQFQMVFANMFRKYLPFKETKLTVSFAYYLTKPTSNHAEICLNENKPIAKFLYVNPTLKRRMA
jgi:hypothetical protein